MFFPVDIEFVFVFFYVTLVMKVSWFLLGRSLADMKRWMHAINIQVRHVFQKEHGVEDDYQGQG